MSDLEIAIAEALEKLTNADWGVTIENVEFVKQDAADAVIFGRAEELNIRLHAKTVCEGLELAYGRDSQAG
ncbi:hypothetical protein QR66_19560 [Chromobacterium piscinae]|nr:hypothetical protein QR66_19560 [Chromobacterium piscinae]